MEFARSLSTNSPAVIKVSKIGISYPNAQAVCIDFAYGVSLCHKLLRKLSECDS